MNPTNPKELLQEQYRAIRSSALELDGLQRQERFSSAISQTIAQNQERYGLDPAWQLSEITAIHAAAQQIDTVAESPEERALIDAIAATGLPDPVAIAVTEAPSLYRAKLDPGATVLRRQAWTAAAIYAVACNLAKRIDRVSAKFAPVVSTDDDGDLLIDFSKSQKARTPAQFGRYITPEFIAANRGRFLFIPGVAPDGELVVIDRREPGNQSTLRGGMSGSGKSMLEVVDLHIQALLLSPDQLHLWLADPHAGLSPYEGLPLLHGRTIATDAIGAFQNAVDLVAEMDRRKAILKREAIDNVDDLADRLPYCLGKFDEFSGLCESLDLEIENVSDRWPKYFRFQEDKDGNHKLAPNNPKPSTVFINLLSQIAKQGRKYGVHIDIIEQNPKADILPTSVKSELVSIALKMKTSSGSRVILDSIGAEKLLGKGDALLLRDGQNVRIQVLLKDANLDVALRKRRPSVRPSATTSRTEVVEVLPDYWKDGKSTWESGFQALEVAEVLPTFLAEYLQFNPSETLETVADRAAKIVAEGSRSRAIKDIFGLTGGRRYPEASAALDYLLNLPK
jgi:hypothetical protein